MSGWAALRSPTTSPPRRQRPRLGVPRPRTDRNPARPADHHTAPDRSLRRPRRLDATSPDRAWKLQEHEDSSNDRREKPNDADDFLLGTSRATGVRIDSPDPPFKRISDILSDADKDNPHYYKPAKRFDGNGYREVRNIGGHAGQ